jgi:hypothetical protein
VSSRPYYDYDYYYYYHHSHYHHDYDYDYYYYYYYQEQVNSRRFSPRSTPADGVIGCSLIKDAKTSFEGLPRATQEEAALSSHCI